MSPRLHTFLMTTTALLALAPRAGVAGPDGANVVGGAASVAGAGTGHVTVNQTSQAAIINWNSFNIGTGQSTQFIQPNSSSVILNRVTGGLGPSTIDGTLSANGKVFLVNRDGMLFGPNSVVNTAGFVATTHDIKNEDFMAGRYNFNISGRPDASIVNQGHITATSGGFAALVAPGVRNTGTITATLGTVSLASGNMFTLDLYGDKLIQLGVNDEIAAQVRDVATGQPLKSLVSNEGKLKANGGRVELTAAAARVVVDSVINNKGVIEANSIGTRNGMIVLGAATGGSKSGLPKQTVKVAGKLSAKGRHKGTTGGTIVVTGENIEVASAKINASGKAGGGKVLIGGDWAGGHPALGLVDNQSAQLEANAIATATTLSVDSATTINASARNTGNGGKVVLWSDEMTTFAGTIFAQGGRDGGNGGFVETSGHNKLAFTGNVDTRAPNGAAGTLLLDPHNLTVVTTGTDTTTQAPTGTFTSNVDSSVIQDSTVNTALAGGNVVLVTGTSGTQAGDITFDISSNVHWSTASTLTVSAARDITLLQGAQITNTGAGNLVLRADNAGTGTGTVNFFGASSADFRGSTGTVSIYYNPDAPRSGGSKYTNSNATIYSGDVTTLKPDQLATYMLVNSATDLPQISTNGDTLDSNYALGRSFDAGSLTTSIGTFTGIFDGNGGLGVNSGISNLSVPLFSAIGNGNGVGTVRNLNLTNVAISAIGGGNIGALATTNNGSIVNVSVAGTVTSSSGVVGGLVAVNETNATITGSFSAGAITATTGTAGGLVGSNGGAITNSYSVAAVSGGAGTTLGGLVGVLSNGTITDSYAAGRVSGGNPGSTGGLVGSSNAGSVVTASYWDTLTSGQATSAGGTGLTTATLQAGRPAGWDPTVWSIVPGVSYPFLNWQFPGGTPQVVSGIAYSDSGLTAAAGVTVNGLLSGNALISSLTGGAVTTGANGYYYYLLAPGTISAPNNNQLLTYTSGATGGATFLHNAPGSTANLDIYGTYLRGITTGDTLSALATARDIAIGNNPSVQSFVSGLANRRIDANGPNNFVIDQAISTGTLVLRAASAMSQTAPISGTALALLGPGSYTLTAPGNHVGTLAANTGAVNFADGQSLTVGTVGNTSGVTTTGAFTLNVNGTIAAPAAVNVGTMFTLAGGNWMQNIAALPDFSAADFRIAGGSFLRVTGGAGAAGNPYSIADVYGLQGVGSLPLGNSYVLANDINASGTTGWNGGLGFKTIGTTFTGSFDGQNHAIDHLLIASSQSPTGLFGFIGSGASVSNLKLTNVNVASTSNLMLLGALAGENDGTVSNVSVSGAVNGGAHTGIIAGGVVGQNRGSITGSSSAAVVSVGDALSNNSLNIAGGLVGSNQGSVTQSSASGNVTGGALTFVGGLIGQNGLGGPGGGAGTVSASSATGSVAGGTNSSVGGLVGFNGTPGTVTGSHASGDVALMGNGGWAGGLVGQNNGLIELSFYGSGSVSGNGTGSQFAILGGLAGQNQGTINNSHATATINGTLVTAGGLVGFNSGMIKGTNAGQTFADAHISVGGDGSAAGGLVGSSDSEGSIQNANATGSVVRLAGAPDSDLLKLGGLVGQNDGSIDHSTSAVAVTGGFSSSGGLVGQNSGSIMFSSASGNVIGFGTPVNGEATIGGLVGNNLSGASIGNSSASGNVTGGDGTTAGGLVGANAFGVTITASHATGNVSIDNPGLTGGFAGGLVGDNQGTISNSDATGAVSGGQSTSLGGLVGTGSGDITGSHATGNVTGTNAIAVGGLVGSFDGSGSIANSYATGNVAGNNALIIGGLVGSSSGTITQSQASGTVTGSGSAVLTGGLVGENSGTITNSSASGAVSGGLAAGGLVGYNEGTITASVATGAVSSNVDDPDTFLGGAGGLVGLNALGTITNSHAEGAVTVSDGSYAGGLIGSNFGGAVTNSYASGNVSGGASSIVGGLVAFNISDFTGAGQSFTGSHASGNVTGGANSIVGGFFGANLFGTINNAFATGATTGGSGSTVGGFGGLNIGTVDTAFASGAATGGANSFVGGFLGVNFAAVDPGVPLGSGVVTRSYALGAATGGANSFVAGFAAINVGSLDQTYAGGLVKGGAGSTTGGLVASNSYNYDLPPGIALLDPPGTTTNSFWDRQTTGQDTSAGGSPADTAQLAPGLPTGFDPSVWGTNAGQYPFLIALGPSDTTPGTPVLPPSNPQTPQEPQQPTDQPPVFDQLSSVQQVIQDFRPPAAFASVTATEVVNTQAVINPVQQAQGTPQGQSGTNGPGAGNQTPPAPQPIRLNVGEGRYFYLPPVGETRLVANEVVLQLPCNPGAAFDNATRRLRLTVINSQCMGQTAVYRVQISSGQTLNSTIRALAAYRLVAAAQANYTYALAQDAEAETEGDAGQYILEKLKLADIHRAVKGANIPIGVIDSEIDVTQPELEGIIADRYDATGDEDKPHPHGTGMAGAIGSHHRLMGIAPSARLFAIRAFSAKSSSAESTTFNILKGLDWAVSHQVRIINMSFAGPKDPSLERALKAAHDKGIVLVAAAGNAGPKSPPLYPAADPSVIAVTATDIDDKLFSGANRGRYVAIAAPGVDILVPAPEGTYQMTTGTSVATAHISGIVALLLERNPRLKPDEIRKILTASAKRLGPSNEFGAGLVDPVKALELAAPRSAAAPGPVTR